ncbi:hypothetical protein DNI29_04995 [Hymenobacter sediminis]|uniref:hypothetical protein n=1 Tax=Hymenobacter sediminis TaxID=2218621 RepID=UPI000F505001|nr:hypothetical protein [Hymenobacter sediminis]RPD50156.1 hypothetical protein DNI29_04995 [Hymenobacter sediminis]
MKYLLTLDSLTLQMVSTSESRFDNKYVSKHFDYKGNAYIVNNRLQLRETRKYELHYLHTFRVWVDGRHVANLSTDCRQPSQPASIKLSFENEIFYTAPGWQHYLNIIEKQLPLAFQSISYLEIAFDFQAPELLRPRLWHIYQHSTFVADNPSPQYAPLRGRQTCSLHHGKTYTFGSKKDGKQIEVYNKSEEIADKNFEKQYILDYWQANGFDLDKPAERIEAKLGSKYFARQKDECLPEASDLHGPALWHIFRKAVGDTFTFRKITETTFDANRNKKTATVTIIELPDIVTQPRAAPYTWKDERDESEHRNRIEAKNAVHRYIRYGRSEDLAQLDYLSKRVTAPKGTDWQHLFQRYAQHFTGSTMADQMARVEMFG